MIISTKKGTPKDELEKIVDKFEKQGLDVTLITGKDYNVFGLVGDTTKIDERDVLANPWIDNVTRVSAPYKRANRLFHPADSVIDCGGVKIGGKEKIAVMAGPCSIEGAEQALRIAQGVKAGGATLFRGGAYKPRTSPYSFQGLETEGILDMVKAREATGMPIVSELMSETVSRSLRSTWTWCRSVPATCRTSSCSRPLARCTSPCCSSAACATPSRSGS